MLTELRVSQYRGFADYRMDGLARVNLFVGKNNSGKTALLEGIQYLASGGDPSVLVEIAQRRGEIILGRPETAARLVDVGHFFYGHQVAPGFDFSIKSNNGYAPIETSVFSVNRDEASEWSARQLLPGLHLKINRASDDREPSIYRVTREGGVNFEAGVRPRRVLGGRVVSGRAERQVRFVGPGSLNTIDLATMWDDVTLAGREADVSAALRVLDERVESIHFLTGMLASGYFPARGGIIVAFRGEEVRVPLGSLGDGMRRMMALATALAFTREGCLFVDEIDTGLHYSVMIDMWRLVVEKAVASNIQVFATTHSWDCIEGLSQYCAACPDMTGHVAIHKIDRRISHSVGFSGESVVRMAKLDIDPR